MKESHLKEYQANICDEKSINLLLEAIKHRIERSMDTPSDYIYLSADIEKRLNEYISATTLKRLFKYIPSDINPRTSTLSILSRYLSYNGWEDFYKNYVPQKKDNESAFITHKCIISSQLKIGDIVEVAWMPNRRCLFEYLGNERFKVIHSENALIKANDSFRVKQFLLNHSLYIDELIQYGTNEKKSYVAGYKSGITYLSVLNANKWDHLI